MQKDGPIDWNRTEEFDGRRVNTWGTAQFANGAAWAYRAILRGGDRTSGA